MNFTAKLKKLGIFTIAASILSSNVFNEVNAVTISDIALTTIAILGTLATGKSIIFPNKKNNMKNDRELQLMIGNNYIKKMEFQRAQNNQAKNNCGENCTAIVPFGYFDKKDTSTEKNLKNKNDSINDKIVTQPENKVNEPIIEEIDADSCCSESSSESDKPICNNTVDSDMIKLKKKGICSNDKLIGDDNHILQLMKQKLKLGNDYIKETEYQIAESVLPKYDYDSFLKLRVPKCKYNPEEKALIVNVNRPTECFIVSNSLAYIRNSNVPFYHKEATATENFLISYGWGKYDVSKEFLCGKDIMNIGGKYWKVVRGVINQAEANTLIGSINKYLEEKWRKNTYIFD